ncbi:MAG: glycosyltransferase family 39 protein, partial [Candidatus Aenigmatarchaeota archaeon]
MPMRFNNLIISGLLFSFSLLLRLPFTSKLLYHWDSVQFALAIKDYNVVLHQPQPPGYILYVLLGRGANFFIHNANSALIALSIIFGAAAVVIVFQLGQLMFGKSAGLLAAALFIFSPTVWFYSEIALSDLPDAFMATSLAFFCYKGITESNKAFLYSLLAAAALGLSGGIRQPTLILLLPLLGFTLWYSAKGRGTIIISAAIAVLTLTTASWLIPMLILTGGLSQYLMALGDLAHRIGWL